MQAAADERVIQFDHALQRLANRVRHWSATRWAAEASDGRERAEVAYELAVTLAELGRRAGCGAPDVAPLRLRPHAIVDQLMLLARELKEAPEAAAYAEAATAAVERADELL